MVYAFSGLCSALGGIVFSASLLAGYGQFASGMELDSIAAVVIGGTALTGGIGTIIGTLFGVMIHGTIVSILQFNGTLSSWWTRIGVGLLTLIAIGIQSVIYIRRKRS
jgi:simple sugar transport system permease protein